MIEKAFQFYKSFAIKRIYTYTEAQTYETYICRQSYNTDIHTTITLMLYLENWNAFFIIFYLYSTHKNYYYYKKHNSQQNMSQAQMRKSTKSVMVLYVPYTFGKNGERTGVNEKQIFWHMRNAKIGHIDHIDCNEWTDKKGTNLRSWFVHFKTWTGSKVLTETLNDGGHFEVPYDKHGHYWKVMKYTPRPKEDTPQETNIRIVPKVDRSHEDFTPPSQEQVTDLISNLAGC